VDLAILISGRGSNLGAIERAVQEKRLDARIRVIVGNRPTAAGLDVARGAGNPAVVLGHDEQMDHGPIIAQAAIAVRDDDTEQTLSEPLLAEEHRFYPLALQRLALGGLSVVGRRVIGGLP
jgi:folate-dependent phosphoribosylglycinamide formyltransferase PurN